jgi:hypothetical protein
MFGIETGGVHLMSARMEWTLRQRALEALEKSTKMLEVACELLKQGNKVEASRVRSLARGQRTISTLLLAQANNVAINSEMIRSRRFSNTGDLPRNMTGH